MMSSRHGRKAPSPYGQVEVGRLAPVAPTGLQHPGEDVGLAMYVDVRLGELVGWFPHEVICEDRRGVVVFLEGVAAPAGGQERLGVVEFQRVNNAEVQACR